MKHPSVNSKKVAFPIQKNQQAETFVPEIMADSLEVMEIYCLQKIHSLQTSLNNLTIDDHTREIIFLCREIKREKNLLMQIERKRKNIQGNIS